MKSKTELRRRAKRDLREIRKMIEEANTVEKLMAIRRGLETVFYYKL
jgi:plasmid stabilization system protein ParE